jgi:hypothetical protein
MTDTMSAVTALPPRAMRCLVGSLTIPEGSLLPCHWYEYPKANNMDQWPRHRLLKAAEDAGFVVIHDPSHYAPTPAGRDWARLQSAKQQA